MAEEMVLIPRGRYEKLLEGHNTATTEQSEGAKNQEVSSTDKERYLAGKAWLEKTPAEFMHPSSPTHEGLQNTPDNDIVKETPVPVSVQKAEKKSKPKWTLNKIIRGFSKQHLQAAHKLFEHMEDHASVLDWDNKGRLIYKGKTILNSNIRNLVYNIFKKKRDIVIGFKQFIEGCKEIGIPNDVLSLKEPLKKPQKGNDLWIRY